MKSNLPTPDSLRISACLLAASLIVGCHRAEPAAKGTAPVPVQVAKSIRQTLPVTQNAIGTVQPLRSVSIKSQVDGVIAEIHFREGDEVKAGDLLVTLDRRPFDNSRRSAQADLATARA